MVSALAGRQVIFVACPSPIKTFGGKFMGVFTPTAKFLVWGLKKRR